MHDGTLVRHDYTWPSAFPAGKKNQGEVLRLLRQAVRQEDRACHGCKRDHGVSQAIQTALGLADVVLADPKPKRSVHPQDQGPGP